MNPYLNIMFATTHPDRPSEAITREQAVIAYTATSAYAEFAEKDKGTLEPGKLADLAVLSQDIFTVPLQDLPKTESILTLVGGKVVYDAHALADTDQAAASDSIPVQRQDFHQCRCSPLRAGACDPRWSHYRNGGPSHD
jgi:hypothetical protein